MIDEVLEKYKKELLELGYEEGKEYNLFDVKENGFTLEVLEPDEDGDFMTFYETIHDIDRKSIYEAIVLKMTVKFQKEGDQKE